MEYLNSLNFTVILLLRPYASKMRGVNYLVLFDGSQLKDWWFLCEAAAPSAQRGSLFTRIWAF